MLFVILQTSPIGDRKPVKNALISFSVAYICETTLRTKNRDRLLIKRKEKEQDY